MDINEKLQSLRVNYQSSSLDIEDCNSDPVKQLDLWVEQAIDSKCDEPNAFVLSTVRNEQPRTRVVLLKGIKDSSFIFYTNYSSAKGSELIQNEKVAMNFLWLPLQRQIRVEGIITKVDSKTSDDYFHKRPRGSQLGAIASPQSQIVKNRKELETLFLNTEEKYKDTDILPRPDNWGGYAIIPHYVEFWQGRNNRMHDRICYEKKNLLWELHRLAP